MTFHRSLLLTLLATVVAGVPLVGQSDYQVPRTPWGDPDLQGVWPSNDLNGVPMERPEQYGTREFITEEEFQQRQQQVQRRAAQANPSGSEQVRVGPPSDWTDTRRQSRQTSLIVDPPNGRMPPLTQTAIERNSVRPKPTTGAPERADQPSDLDLYDRCVGRGLLGSILPSIYNNGNQIVQAPGYVVILNEMIHEARVVPLDGRPHTSSDIRTWMGDSRGHWEGGTLVVETKNVIGNQFSIGINGIFGQVYSDQLVLTERFTRVADDRLVYEAIVNDPETFTAPFTIRYPLIAEPGYQLFEYACHEGNYAMFNTLQGARLQEAEAAGGGK